MIFLEYRDSETDDSRKNCGNAITSLIVGLVACEWFLPNMKGELRQWSATEGTSGGNDLMNRN